LSGAYLGSEIEQSHEALVEGYVDRHPWSTVQEIRDGIEAEHGPRIERVQARLHTIARRRVVDTRTDEGSLVARYRLGPPRARAKACGIEATVVDGHLRVWIHSGVDPRVAAEVEAIRAEVEAALGARVLPLLGEVEEEEDLAAWLRASVAA
jgi:hypothetical protein